MCSCNERAAHILGLIRALWLLLACAQSTVRAESNEPPVRIDPLVLLEGQPFSATYDTGETVTLEFKAARDQVYLIRVGQQDFDLAVTVTTPDGIAQSYNSPLGRDGDELVLLDRTPGLYRISLRSDEEMGTIRDHTILLTAVGTGEVASSARINAWRLMSNAAAANASGSRADLDEALKAYGAAVELWRGIGDQRELAQALYSTAMLKYLVSGEWQAADQVAAEAASLYAAIDEPALEANAVLLQAMALTEAINEADEETPILDSVTEYLEKSYVAHERLGNIAQLAKIRYFNALSNLNAGRYEEAKTYYGEAAQLYANIDDWKGERNILLDRAVIDIDTGNMDGAIRALQDLRRLDEERNPEPTSAERNFVGTVLDQLGAAQRDVSDIDGALESFSSARNIHDDAGDLHGKAESLRGIAGIYLESGDLTLGRDFLRQAEVAAIASNNGRVLGIVQATLGNMAYSEADYQSATAFYAKAVDAAPQGGPIRAHRQGLLAKAHIASGHYETAIGVANQALEGAVQSKSPRIEADALLQIGKAHLGLRDPSQSIHSLEQALARYERLGLSEGQADVDHALALSLADLGRSSPDSDAHLASLDDALARSEQSLLQVEGLVGKVSAPELRAHYAATRRGYYQTHIDLLMERSVHSDESNDQYLSQALATSERARARMTMDLLNEASVDLQQRVNPEIAGEMNHLLNQLEELDRQREVILNKGGVDQRVGEDLTELANRMSLIKNQFALLQVELRRSSGHYRALTAPATVSLSEIQYLLDSESVMLEYSLGEYRSFVWLVTNDSLDVIQLADRATIETAAERLFASLHTLEYGASARAEQEDALRTVSRLIIQPLAHLIGKKRLVIIADGSLNYLPFQTLASGIEGRSEQLLDTREVVALPSMSVLAALRARASGERPAKSLAVFADPVFEKTDPRLGGVGVDEAHDNFNAGQDRSFVTRSSLAGFLPRLEGTLAEAHAITALVSQDEPFVAVGFRASREAVLGQNLGDYRFLHFATHGRVDRKTPALSALVLSRFDERGAEQNGYLRLHDIYGLEMNADLVVLSACETGLGTDIYGEGLVGLTQGFLYAGARSLLVSLWNVPDRATAELMTEFYREIFDQGSSPAAALRHAQQSMASDRRWNDPYFWGAFVLLGDWRQTPALPR